MASKHLNFILFLLLVLSACKTSNPVESDSHEPDQSQSSELKLVWSDEFDYEGAIDGSLWDYDLGGHGWGNKELQNYTNRIENARIENGLLIIEALKETLEGNDYTSARIVTKNKGDWKYGRIEVKARLPEGVGTWPAIWMLPTLKGSMSWPADGEIDIMEHVGYDPGIVHGTVHTEAYNHIKSTQKGGEINIEDATEAFHVYAIDWNADSISWLVDNTKYYVFKNEKSGQDAWPFDNNFHLILNIAVGGSWGGQEGVDDSIWPRRMEVDWVRVYQEM